MAYHYENQNQYPVQAAGDDSTGRSHLDYSENGNSQRSSDTVTSNNALDYAPPGGSHTESTRSYNEVRDSWRTLPSIDAGGVSTENDASTLGLDEDLQRLHEMFSIVDANNKLDNDQVDPKDKIEGSITPIRPLTQDVGSAQRWDRGQRTSSQRQPNKRPERPQPAPRTKKYTEVNPPEKTEPAAALPKANTVRESETGTKPKVPLPLTASQKATEQVRTPGQPPAGTIFQQSKETVVNRQSQSANVAAINQLPVANVIDNNFGKAKPSAYTVAEGNMDGQGNILADDEKEALTQFQLHMQKGKLKEQRDKYNESIIEFKEALRYQILARGENHPDIAKTHGLLGRLYHKAGKNQEAVDELLKELKVYEHNQYSVNNGATDLWQCHDILAQAYDGMRDTEKEIEHYEKAISILIKSTSIPPERLPHMHNNVGNAYRNAGRLNEAREHLEKAKEMMMLMHCLEPVEDMAKVNSSLGDVYNDLGLTQLAIDELETCIQIREKTRPGADGALLRGGTHQTLATLYERIGNMAKSQEHADKSKTGLKGLMGSKEDREHLLQDLAGMVKGHNATGVLGRLAAGLTASDDINKAQMFQAANDNKQAIQHYEKGILSLNQLPDDVRNSEELLSTLALCYNNVGNAYRKTNQWANAEESLRRALEIRRTLFADEPSEDTGSTLFNLGHLLQGIGGRQKTQEALDMHLECLEMYKKMSGSSGKHKTWIVSLYRGLGVGYERMGNSRKSIEMYEHAKEYLTEAQDADELRAVCNNVGNSYESIGDFPNAEKNIMQALNMAVIQAIDNPDTDIQNHIAAGHNNLGVLYQTWEKLDKALDHLKESLSIREKIKNDNAEAAYDVASSHHNIGNTLAKMGRLQEALDYYQQELEIRRNLKSDTTGVRVSMSQVYDKLGETAKAEELLADNYDG